MAESLLLIKKLERFFEGQPEIKIAILYGSYAKGNPHAKSDVDIGVASRKTLSTEEKLNLIGELEQVIGKNIDLVDILGPSRFVVWQMLRYGVVVKKSDEKLWQRIYLRTVHWLMDVYPIIQKVQDLRKKAFLEKE
ncbi:MAG: nucleotidyltransferase domain-containing protein [Candidatus Hydrogenedentota bacterium]|nr:MAG: nucleotidyltransferase domain-containing protein [Candidatus Hydrogenedentota bacterium]